MQMMPITNLSQDMPSLSATDTLSSSSARGEEFRSVLSRHADTRGVDQLNSKPRPRNSGERQRVDERGPKRRDMADRGERKGAPRDDSDEFKNASRHVSDDGSHRESRRAADSRIHKDNDAKGAKKSESEDSKGPSDRITALMMFMGILSQHTEQMEGDANRAADLLLSGVFDDTDNGKASGLEELFSKLRELLDATGKEGAAGNIQNNNEELRSLLASLLSSAQGSKKDELSQVPNSTADQYAKDPFISQKQTPSESAANLLLAATDAENNGGDPSKIDDSIHEVPTSAQQDNSSASAKDLSAKPGSLEIKSTINDIKIKADTLPKDKNAAKKAEELAAQLGSKKEDSGNTLSNQQGQIDKTIASALETAKESASQMERKDVHGKHPKHLHNVSEVQDKTSSSAKVTVIAEGKDGRGDMSGNHSKASTLVMNFRQDAKTSSSDKNFSLGSSGTLNDSTSQGSSLSSGFSSHSVQNITTETASTAIDTDLRTSMMEQLRQGITRTVALNRNRAVIHLNPPELGSVTIRISVNHNNHVQASFITEHTHTNQLLQSGMETLKNQLAQNGFDLGQVNINLSDSGMNNAHTFHKDHSQNGNSRFANDFKEEKQDAVTEIPTTGNIIPDHGGSMHVIL